MYISCSGIKSLARNKRINILKSIFIEMWIKWAQWIFYNISNFHYKSVIYWHRPHKASMYILNIFFLTLCKWNYYSCLNQSFDFRSRLVKSWEIFANWDWLWLCMPAAGNHEETIKPIQSLLHAISLRHAGAAGSHGVHTRYILESSM